MHKRNWLNEVARYKTVCAELAFARPVLWHFLVSFFSKTKTTNCVLVAMETTPRLKSLLSKAETGRGREGGEEGEGREGREGREGGEGGREGRREGREGREGGEGGREGRREGREGGRERGVRNENEMETCRKR